MPWVQVLTTARVFKSLISWVSLLEPLAPLIPLPSQVYYHFLNFLSLPVYSGLMIGQLSHSHQLSQHHTYLTSFYIHPANVGPPYIHMLIPVMLIVARGHNPSTSCCHRACCSSALSLTSAGLPRLLENSPSSFSDFLLLLLQWVANLNAHHSSEFPNNAALHLVDHLASA